MFLSQKKIISTNKIFNVLLSLLPVSFIAGNLIINLNVVLIIILTLIFFGKKLFQIRFYIIDKIIFLFFFLIIFTGTYNDIYFILTDSFPAGFDTIKKSLFFLRYLLLYISLRYLIENNIIDLKYFFISSFLCSLFVCLDIFYQLYFGKDIFGFEIVGSGRRLSGPFGDELIAGGYLLRFSIFSFFLIPLFFKSIQNRFLFFFIPTLMTIFVIGIILSGNRMPLIMYLFTVFLIMLFQKQTRKYLLVFITTFLIVFYLNYNFNKKAKYHYSDLYTQISQIAILITSNKPSNVNSPQYYKEFESFYDTWLMNKYIGGGIKNFRWYCHHRKPGLHNKKGYICNMHPHNYYLEILTETGLVGMGIILIIFSQILFLTFYKKYFSNSPLRYNNLIVPFIFLFIAEIFPIKSTGSFFTTNNTTYLFLIIAILIGIVNRDNLIENK